MSNAIQQPNEIDGQRKTLDDEKAKFFKAS